MQGSQVTHQISMIFQQECNCEVLLYSLYNAKGHHDFLPHNLQTKLCYVRQCSLVLKIVLDFFKCLGFRMHFISLYDALNLHNCSSSGSLVFAHLGGIN